MQYFTKEQLLECHLSILRATGGLEGVRDEAILDSILCSSFVTFDGQDLYPTVLDKICHVCCMIATSHPFSDGNKRTASLTLLILLMANNFTLDYEEDETVEVICAVAQQKIMEEDFSGWVAARLCDRG